MCLRLVRRPCCDIFRSPTIHFPLTITYKQISQLTMTYVSTYRYLPPTPAQGIYYKRNLCNMAAVATGIADLRRRRSRCCGTRGKSNASGAAIISSLHHISDHGPPAIVKRVTLSWLHGPPFWPNLVDNGRSHHCAFGQQTGPDTTKDPPGSEFFQSLLNLCHLLRVLRLCNNPNLHHPCDTT